MRKKTFNSFSIPDAGYREESSLFGVK